MFALLRYLLLPLGYIYAAGAWMRRFYFRIGRKSKSGGVYTIAIGNLAAGGSGKTPMTLFVAQKLKNNSAVLSRGYKRKIKGFREVEINDMVENCGDEPLEMKNASPELPVFVCEKRLEGIGQLLQIYPDISNVVLDDAFQHLPLKADKYVLLTDYQKPFYQDWPMPAGRLREFPCTAAEADVIVVTKCPADLSEQTAGSIRQKLEKYGKPVFFCHYENAVPINKNGDSLASDTQVLAVSGLAGNDAFRRWSDKNYTLISFFGYPDHHAFSESDYGNWTRELQIHENAVILTTRKDYARMRDMPDGLKNRLFITFTTPKFLFQQEDAFIRILFNYF